MYSYINIVYVCIATRKHAHIPCPCVITLLDAVSVGSKCLHMAVAMVLSYWTMLDVGAMRLTYSTAAMILTLLTATIVKMPE